MGPANDKLQAPTNGLKLYVRAVIESEARSKYKSLRKEITANVWKQNLNNLDGDLKATSRDFYRYDNGKKKDAQGILSLKEKEHKWCCTAGS